MGLSRSLLNWVLFNFFINNLEDGIVCILVVLQLTFMWVELQPFWRIVFEFKKILINWKQSAIQKSNAFRMEKSNARIGE